MIEIIEENGQRFAKVRDLKKWKDNPRDVRGEDFQRLKRQLELGEHSTLLVTADGEVLGGNTRLRAYRETGKKLAKVVVVEFEKAGRKILAKIDGVIAERKFDSVEQAKLEYALSHNDMIGTYREQKLAELVKLYPIPMEVFKISTVVRPIEDVANEHGVVSPEDRSNDEDKQDTDALDKYMAGSIKQIVLYYSNEEYAEIIPRLERLRAQFEAEDNSRLLLDLMGFAEANERK